MLTPSISNEGKNEICMVIMRILLIFGAIVVLSSVSCMNKKYGENIIILTITHGTVKEEMIALDEASKIFEKRYPNIRVKRIAIEGPYYPKIETMIAGDTAPDVMWMGQGFGEFASRNIFMNLEPLIGKDENFVLDDYYSQALNMYRYQEILYGLPYGIDLSCLFYNKHLFDEAGLSYPDETWVLENMVETAKKLTKYTSSQIDYYGLYLPEPYLGAFGAALLNEYNTRCLLYQPEAISALRFWLDLSKKYKVSPARLYGEFQGMGVGDAFKMGKIAMIGNYTWSFSDYKETIRDFEWDIALFPKGRMREHWSSSGGFAIFRETKHPKEAWLLLKYLASREFQIHMTNLTLPSLKMVSEEAARNHSGPPQHYTILLEAVKYMKPNPRIPNITEIVQKKKEAEEYALVEQKTAEEAYKWATNEINKILEKCN